MKKIDDSLKNLIGQIFHFSTTTLAASFLSMAQGVLVLTLVDPSVYGIWASLALILEYGMYLHFGLINGMERSIPFFRGHGEEELAKRCAGAAKYNLFLLSGIIIGALVAVTIFFGSSWKGEIRYGVFVVGFAAVIFLGVQFYQGILKVNQKFKRVGYVELGRSAAMFASLFFIWKFGFDGFLIRAIFAMTCAVIVAKLLSGDKSLPYFDKVVTGHLLRTGFPIMMVGAAGLVLFSMDRLIILTFLGTTMVGFFGICVALFRVMNLFPTVAGQVFAPVMAGVYGATLSPRALMKHALHCSGIAVILCLGFTIVFFFPIPWLVERFLSKYAYGIPAMRVMFLNGLLVAVAVGPGYVLQTIMRQREYLTVIIISAAVMWGASILFLSSGWDILGVAWSISAGFGVYAAGLWFYSWWFCLKEKRGTFRPHKRDLDLIKSEKKILEEV